MSDKSKPKEHKKQEALSSAPVVDGPSKTITVPVLKYKLDAKTRELLVKDFVFEGANKKIKTEIKGKAEKEIADEKEKAKIINRKKMEMFEEFYHQLRAAIKSLNETLDGSATDKATPDSLRELFKRRPEEIDVGFDECIICRENFSTQPDHQFYPYMNSEGETLTYDCSKLNTKISYLNRQELVFVQCGDKESLYIPNHELVDAIKNRPVFVKKVGKFVERFVAVAASLLSGKAQPVADEKSSHTTTTSSSSSVQAAAIPDPKDIDPEMMIFLLEMGISWEFFPFQSFLTMFEKLSSFAQRRCFTVPTKNNSIFVYEACVGKYSKKFSKMVFDVAKQCVNAPDEAGRTALMQAVAVGDIAGAEVLLSLGANIDAVDNAGGTVLHDLAFRDEVASEVRLPFLRNLKEKLESGEAKKSQQESQVDKWQSFVDLPNKAGLAPLLLGAMNRNTGFLKDLISFEEIFLLVLEQMEDFGKYKTCAEQVEILKQYALEFAATRANTFAKDSGDFARYMGYVESLIKIKPGARISEDFVKQFAEGGVKDFLQERLNIRKDKREKYKKKKESKSKAKLKESNGPSLPPEQILTRRSKLCLEMLARVPPLFGVAPLDWVIKHFETEGDSCVRHLTQLLESKQDQDQEASAFFDAMMKILKENQLNVITALKKMGYSDSQLTSLIWVFNKKVLEMSALMEKLAPSVTSQEIPAVGQLARRDVLGSPPTFLPFPRPSPSNIADSKISSSLSTRQSDSSSGVGSPSSFPDVPTISPSDDKDSNFLVKRQLQNLKSATSKALIGSLNQLLLSVVNKDNFEDVWKCFCSCAEDGMTHRENLGKASILVGELAAFQGLLITKISQILKIFLDSNLPEEQKEMMKQWAEANVYSRLSPAAMQSSSESQPAGGKSPGLG